MRVVIIYKDKTDRTGLVEDYQRDYKIRTGRDLERINPDSIPGSSFCELYDIVDYPTIMALSHDGSVANMWSGLPLPLISEVGYYQSLSD